MRHIKTQVNSKDYAADRGVALSDVEAAQALIDSGRRDLVELVVAGLITPQAALIIAQQARSS